MSNDCWLLLLLLQRRPKLLAQQQHYAARHAADQAAQAPRPWTPTAAAASTAPSAAEAAAEPSLHHTKPPPFSRYYQSPVSDSCSPLRPAYAADLRDASLTAAGYAPSRVKASDVNFAGYNNADGLGTMCTVNNELFTFPDYNPLVMEMGEVVQWTTNNAHSHPLHVHTQPFQLTSFNLSNMYVGTALTSFFQVGFFPTGAYSSS
eukprot:GHRQ01013195.1.p1 GENE.GHRQ01013195.1~~GHRQ01013195.1.p1  ORF type:complete len:205 (-),score=30.97 GHRQ01013195.1:1639-2253(-)